MDPIDKALRVDATASAATVGEDDDDAERLIAALSVRVKVRRRRSAAAAAAATTVVVSAVFAGVLGGNFLGADSRTTRAASALSGRGCGADFELLSATASNATLPWIRVSFAYKGTKACHISSYGPTLEVRDHTGAAAGSISPTSLVQITPSTRKVQAHEHVSYSLRWTSNCSKMHGPYTLELFLGGDSQVRLPTTLTLPGPPCDPAARALQVAQLKPPTVIKP